MSGYYDRIHGKDRLLRIRRIRKALLAGVVGLTALLVLLRMQSEGASLKPLFLPINGLFEVALLMGLTASVGGLFLRNLEIRHVQRESQRYLMAKYSMTRSLRTAIASIVIAGILLLAITPGAMASALAQSPQVVSLEPGESKNVTFTSPDPSGLTFVRYAVVTVTTGDAFVQLTKNNVTQKSAWLNASEPETLEVELEMWSALATWSLVFVNAAPGSTYLTFILQRGAIPTLFSSVPLLLILYGAGHVGWYVVLRPIREKTRSSALYSAAAEMDSGERLYEEAMPTIPAVPALAMDVSPPPPPVQAAAAAPPPTVVPRAVRTIAPAPLPAPEVPKPVRPRIVDTPDTPETFVAKASALVAAGAHEAALAAYHEALRLNPDLTVALLGRAACLAALGRRSEAVDLYRTMLTKDPRNFDALRELARLLAEERRWRECLEPVEEILRARPDDAWALEVKGDVLTNLGRRPEALAAYEAAVLMDPANGNLRQKIEEVRVDVPGLMSRALIGSASGNYNQALALFDEILEVEPSNVNALIGKAVAYRRSGKPQEALNCLDLVLGVQPMNASALLNRGNILQEEGDLEGALDAYDRLTTVFPNDEEAWAGQGDVLVKMNRAEDALRAYTEAQRLSPGDETIQRRILEIEAAKVSDSDVFEELRSVKGVGEARAQAILDAGFAAPKDLARATVEDLVAVKGITRKIAEDVVKHFRGLLTETPVR